MKSSKKVAQEALLKEAECLNAGIHKINKAGFMLGHMQFAGRGGQFRTPRHIIRMMVQMVDPKPRERIGDLAGGTGGGVNAHLYILEKHTSAGILEYDAEG